jgi:sigma-B regulation protein RsbU (phosphoserine phosphatase)
MKRSIEKKVILVFSITFVLIIAASAALGYNSAYSSELERNRTVGRSAAYITEEVLNTIGLDLISDPQNDLAYQMARQEVRTICKSLSLSYLYVYTVDENEVRHYVMTVATDDELDDLVREGLGLGVTSKEPLREQERVALGGSESDERFLLNNRFGKTSVWITPYISPDGKIAALIGAEVSVEISNSAILRQFLVHVLPVIAFLTVAFLVLFFLMRRHMIRPLHELADRMEQFDPASETAPIRIRTHDEIRKISDAFQTMSRDIRTYIGNIETITAQQQYESAQMDVARRIQYGMVPAATHLCEAGVEISGMMKPAKQVGGDFYDCFTLSDGRYCALIADVSGKGVAGALFMALVKNLVHDRIRQLRDPADALKRVNDELCAQNPEGMFVTVFALLLDPLTGTVQFANAGHNPPVLIVNGSAAYLKPKPGIALGLFEDADIETETLTLSAGDAILLYTDGVTEAVSAERAFYGKDRLLALLETACSKGSRTLTDAVQTSVAEFSAGCEQSDDITIVCVACLGAGEPKPVPVSLDGFAPIKQEILSLAKDSANSRKIVLACEEAFVNVVRYASATEADYCVRRDGSTLTFVLRDNGVRFDPFSETLKQDAEFLSMDEGGLGIRFIRNIAKNTSWNYTDGRNTLTLVFGL